MKTFRVYYAIDPNFGHGARPELGTLLSTHRLLTKVEANDLEEVFYKMQGEVWSPNGEARILIRALGLKHTSMSIGDVALNEENKKYYAVDLEGFSEIA